jgi:hypothetical protein
VVAVLNVTVRLLVVVVDGVSALLPTELPVPHSYTAPEPALPPLAVNVTVVAVPLHIVVTLEDKPVGAVGGVEVEIETVTPPEVVALHAPVPRRCTQ